MSKTTPGKRLYLTADKDRLVEEGDPKAAFLYCTDTAQVPAAELERLMRNSDIEESAASEPDETESDDDEPFDVDSATKKELEAFARERFGVDLDRRVSVDKLRQEVRDLKRRKGETEDKRHKGKTEDKR